MTTAQLSTRGALTLPKKMRAKFGWTNEVTVLLEDTDQGILIRPAVVSPIEYYSEKRMAEFDTENNQALAGFVFPTSPKKKSKK